MGYPKGFRKCVSNKDLQRIKWEIEKAKEHLPETVYDNLDKILDIVNYYLNK